MFKKSKLIITLIIISIIVILSLPLSISTNIKIKLVDFFSPIMKVSSYIVENIFSLKNIFTAVKENKNLKKDMQNLTARCNELQETSQENQRLRQLLDFKKQIPYETIACRVISRDASIWNKTLVLGKGIKSGVCVDMVVMNASGVVGRIIESDDDVSRVLLITDANSSIGGMTQDSRIVGLVEGDGSDLCVFNLLSRKEDIPSGTIVVTSGFSRIFPKGLKVGIITEVMQNGQGLYKTAKIKLSADINSIEEVLILKTPITKKQ